MMLHSINQCANKLSFQLHYKITINVLFVVFHFCCSYDKASWVGGHHNMPHPPQVDHLTWKVVYESGVTWATTVPILVFLSLCSRLRPDICDRQMSDRQTSDMHPCLMPLPYWGGHNKCTYHHMMKCTSHIDGILFLGLLSTFLCFMRYMSECRIWHPTVFIECCHKIK